MSEDLILRYDRPATRWIEALPLGNGRTGAMCFGGVGTDRLQLNDEGCWSGSPTVRDALARPRGRAGPEVLASVRSALLGGRPREAETLLRGFQGGHTQSFLPLADLRVAVRVGDRELDDGEATGYERRLDLGTAVAGHEYTAHGVRVRHETWISAPAGVLVARVSSDRPGALAVRLRLDSPLRHATHVVDGALALHAECPADVFPPHQPSEAPVSYGGGMAAAVAVRMASDGEAAGGDGVLGARGASAVTIVVATQAGYRGPRTPPRRSAAQCLAQADARVRAALARDHGELRREHVDDHRRLFARVALDLGGAPERARLPTDERLRRGADPGLAALLCQYGHYLLIASSRSAGLPANLQGIWNEHVRPPWSSNYTLNINAQMNYWPAETTGLAECHDVLLDFVADLARGGRETARALYGAAGWTAHHNSDAWGWTAPVGEGRGDPKWANWAMGGAWLCRHLWEHYEFGEDEAYLRDRAWPVMRGAAEFCLDWLVELPDGTLGTLPSTSPENEFVGTDGAPAAVTSAATMDLALIGELFDECLAAGAVLGLGDPLLDRIAAARRRLRAPRVGSRGELLEWGEELPEVDPHHRHHSHLAGLFPGRSITPAATPDLAAAAARTLDLRGDTATGWSLAWKIALRARLGDGAHAHTLLEALLTLTEVTDVRMDEGAGVYANLLCAHPPFQIDGNFGATAAIAEMLLQSHAGELHLLPALPAAWPHGTVRGLRARGNLAVDVQWREGRLAGATITAARDRDVVVRAGGERARVGLRGGVPVRLGPALEPAG
jgi:alpha-L-fucosidase 2